MTATIAALTPHQTTGSKNCHKCGAEFQIPEWMPKLIADASGICEPCSHRDAIADGQKLVEKSKLCREQTWRRICPPDYLDTVPSKLPFPMKLNSVIAWKYGPKGLLLHSPTGAGKSRCAWMLLKREWEAGRTVKSLNASAGLTYAEKYSRSPDEVGLWIDRLCQTDLLLLDDVFKSKLTDSFESALFTIVMHRTEHKLPIIVTTNDNGDSLLQRFSPDRGEPFVRRIKEFCTLISFAK